MIKDFSAPIIDLEWERDGDGYELLPEEPGPPGQSLLTDRATKPMRIVPRDGRAIAYAPMALDDLIYARFASVHTPEDALGFVTNHGMLTQLHGAYEAVSDVLRHAAWCRFFLGQEGRYAVEAREWRLGRVDLVLAPDPASGALRLRLRPPTLLAAIWLQLGQKLSGSARPFRECRYCGVWFETGPGTGRRADAEFCTIDHQQTFNSRKRSKRGQNHV